MKNRYQLATVTYRGFTFPVIEVDGKLISISHGYNHYKEVVGKQDLFMKNYNYTMLDILEKWSLFEDICDELSAFYRPDIGKDFDFFFDVDEVKFEPPILYPDKILNAGSNYHDHALEMGAAKPEKEGHEPYFFYKGRTHTIIGHKDVIRLTPRAKYIDWEAELAIVIGKTAKNVSASDALEYVAGYTCYNDISGRDRMIRKNETFDYDWFSNKGNDTFGPLGPYIVPSKFISDPNNLPVKLYLNGELMQDTNTNLMVWDIAELIETASSVTTLSPGDIIATGTGAGVGMGKGIKVKHGEIWKVFEHMYAGKSIMLKDGDTVVVDIDEVGQLENKVEGY
ncbi:MAG: fumarylacetoacetate hydrolase family protein [Saccharofermentanales bacterium]